MASKAIERDLRSLARKNKVVYISQKTKGKIFRAEVGVTQSEKLAQLEFPYQKYADAQGSIESPDSKVVAKDLALFNAEDGSSLRLKAKYNDGQADRSIVSPVFGGHRIHLQIVGHDRSEASDSQVRLVETRELEKRTGIRGFLRPWQILAFGNVNSLTSNRGENNSFLGLPGIDLKYNLGRWDLQPYLSLEKHLVHLGSTLSISELRAGFSQKIKWIQAPSIHWGSIATICPARTREQVVLGVLMGYWLAGG